MTREWNGSLVMEEFAKIAAESGLITTDFDKPIVGNSDKSPTGPFRNNPSVSGKTDTLSVDRNSKDYGVTKETGAELVGKAHPKDPEIAESMGRGWEVENVVQRQEQDIEVATRMPSGALHGKHAELMAALVSLANRLDGEGRREAADRVDRAIGRISDLPFDGGLRKEAFWAGLLTALRGLFWLGTTGLAAWKFGPSLLSTFTSKRETLSKDIQDVINEAANVRRADPSMSTIEGELRAKLSPYVEKFRSPMPAPGDEAGMRERLALVGVFAASLPEIGKLVSALIAVKGGVLEGAGVGPRSRLEESFKDMVATFQDTAKSVEALAGAVKEQQQQQLPGAPGPEATPKPEAGTAPMASGDISEIQSLLAERGLEVPRTGVLDDATKTALRRMEKVLDADLRRRPKLAKVLKAEGWSIVGQLLRPDGKVASPSILRRLIALAYGGGAV